MGYDWRDFKERNGGEEGSRAAFERACKSLVSLMNPGRTVGSVHPNPGDKGIDIYAGDLGREPVVVYQCKFHLEKIGDTQRNQIRLSFLRAAEADEYALSKWVLCLPKVLDFDENKWWVRFKNRANVEVALLDGNDLLAGARTHGLIPSWFKTPASNGNPSTLGQVVGVIKSSAEFDARSVFGHQVITSLHLLLSLCEADVPYPGRRELREFVDVEALVEYLLRRREVRSTSAGTTWSYEELFDRAGAIASEGSSREVSPYHVLQAFELLRPKSVSRYFESRGKDWRGYRAAITKIQRGRLDSPS